MQDGRRALAQHDAGVQLAQEGAMMWTKPSFTDIRFGFEITMYVANR